MIEGFIGWTSLKQSRILMEAGLDPNTADMYYKGDEGFPRPIPYQPHELEHYLNNLPFWKRYDCLDVRIPCWTIGKLIKVLPAKIYEFATLSFLKGEDSNKNESYTIMYDFGPEDITFTEESLIDVVIKMILQQIKEGIITKVDYEY